MNGRRLRHASIRIAACGGPAALFIAGATLAADSTEAARAMTPDRIKATQSDAERKLDTSLRLQLRAQIERAPDPATPNDADERHGERPAADPIAVEIAGTITPALADAVEAAHGTVIEQSPRWGSMRVTLPVSSLLAIAARPDVRRVRLPGRPRVN